MTQKITYNDTVIETFIYDDGKGVKEAHVMIHVSCPTLPYHLQLDALTKAFAFVTSSELPSFVPVFKRYFLSDAANQADLVHATETEASHCAVSAVQQPPLDGTKVALWCYLATDITVTTSESGLYAVSHSAYRHLWGGGARNTAKNSEYQTRLLFNEYVTQLAKEQCTLRDNCIRTWFFVNDVDLNYAGVVNARNRAFFTQGLTSDTHFIASTGIGGRGAESDVLVLMDSYAISGILPEQVSWLYAPTHLNRTSDYGVSFERGTMVDYGDRRHVFISGTASIDNKGRIMHPGNIVSQAHRMTENVEVLLAEAGCDFSDVCHLIIYIRDTADYTIVNSIISERFPDIPKVILLAPVCRPGWLIEMECMAIKPVTTSFPGF